MNDTLAGLYHEVGQLEEEKRHLQIITTVYGLLLIQEDMPRAARSFVENQRDKAEEFAKLLLAELEKEGKQNGNNV